MAGDFGHQYMTSKTLEILKSFDFQHSEQLVKNYCLDSFHKTENGKKLIALPNGDNIFKPLELRKLHVPNPGAGEDFFENGYIEHVYYVFEYFMKRMISLRKTQKEVEFAQAAGVIGHFIQDASCPPHSIGVQWGVDLEIIKLLLPPENKNNNLLQLHSILENYYSEFRFEGYSPKLKGKSPSEAAFNLCADYTDMIENSLALLIPMTQALYKGQVEIIKQCLAKSAIPAVKLYADFLYTTFILASAESIPSEGLNNADLTKAVPYKWSAYAQAPYYCPRIRNSNMSLSSDFSPIPLQLNLNGEIIHFDKGFGVGTPSYISYILPEGVYQKFKAIIGIHSETGASGEVIFQVLANDKIIFDSGRITSSKSKQISVPINHCEVLTLRTIPYCKNNLAENNAIWANPTIKKIVLK